jgi:hypothetical protein
MKDNFCNPSLFHLICNKQTSKMKNFLILLLILVTGIVSSNGQSSSNSCYDDYYTVFRDRGAKQVTDGSNEVVVTIRKENQCICILGKITVKNGKPINDLVLLKEDSTYEKFPFVPSPKYSKNEVTMQNFIHNGMSPSYLSANDEIINLFFIKYLNDHPVKFRSAPVIK